MATYISDVQAQPGSVTVLETAIALDPIRDGSDRRLSTRGSLKDGHACDVDHKQAHWIVETEPNDTTLIPKPMLCKNKSVQETRASITRDLSSQTDLFYQVIESYQKSTKIHHLPPDFDIRKAHNWDEVHQAARLAEAKCKKDGTRTIFGKIGRGIQRSTPAIEPWLGLIPDGDYTSALCGGLKIAFGVAGHIHEQREQIFETFQQIPETIRLAEDRLEEWPDDETLRDAAIELCLAVLESIEAMIIWLVDKSTRKKIWQLLKKPKTEKPNIFGLDVIQKQVKRLQDRATTLQSKAIVRTDANVEKTGFEVDIIKLSTQNIQNLLVKELRPAMLETHSLVQETFWKMDLYANASRSDLGTLGLVRHDPSEPLVLPMGIYFIFGERRINVFVAREEIAGTGALFSKRLSSISPEQWEGISCHLSFVFDSNSNRDFQRRQTAERYASAEYLQHFAMDPNTSRLWMHLPWSPQVIDLAFWGEDALRGSLGNRIPNSKRQHFIKSQL